MVLFVMYASCRVPIVAAFVAFVARKSLRLFFRGAPCTGTRTRIESTGLFFVVGNARNAKNKGRKKNMGAGDAGTHALLFDIVIVIVVIF